MEIAADSAITVPKRYGYGAAKEALYSQERYAGRAKRRRAPGAIESKARIGRENKWYLEKDYL